LHLKVSQKPLVKLDIMEKRSDPREKGLQPGKACCLRPNRPPLCPCALGPCPGVRLRGSQAGKLGPLRASLAYEGSMPRGIPPLRGEPPARSDPGHALPCGWCHPRQYLASTSMGCSPTGLWTRVTSILHYRQQFVSNKKLAHTENQNLLVQNNIEFILNKCFPSIKSQHIQLIHKIIRL